MIEPLPLAKNKKEWFFLLSAIIIFFIINLAFLYNQYHHFKSNELFITDAKIINIYKKQNYNILKMQADNIIFFTKYQKISKIKKLDNINITIITKNISFIDYLKGFYTLSFNIYKIKKQKTLINALSNNINSQHSNKNISELFNAIFLAIASSSYIKDFSSNYGISHLFAISGFHLGVLIFIFYHIIFILYKPTKQKYFPYRNLKFDILIFVSILLFIYVLFLGIIPSLLRAFMMFILGIVFLRSNIKILSFSTLSLVTLLIIALFPNLLLSLSLWFSIIGVFYIFLFLQYFKNINKILLFILFNFWLYLSINPIVHYFFPSTSLIQLYSPIFTIGFSIFYPIELFLHTIGYGNLLDNYIELLFNQKVITKDIFTPNIFFYYYCIISLFSIKYKNIFILLNISFILFNLWLFTS